MGRFELSPGVEAQHRRLDRSAYHRLYVVGDVHGCRATFESLLDAIDPAADDLVICVGDLVRRGPDTKGVVDLVRETSNVVSIRGNNEEKLIRGRRTEPGLTAADLRWLRSLPAVISWGSGAVVHGGVDPRKALADQTVDDVQETESIADTGRGRPYWWDRYEGPVRLFFGHKVLSEPYVTDHAVGLDTGCVYGGPLSAYDCARDRVIAVEPERTHRDRRAARFLDPGSRSAES